jgi:peptidoglycan/xylan/chitin deacetylase (PgdA/CDA1 family)
MRFRTLSPLLALGTVFALALLAPLYLKGNPVGPPQTDCRAATAHGASLKTSGLRLQQVGQIPKAIPTSRRVVALTFDAGGNDGGAAKIYAALRRSGAKATFFMTGRWAEVYPDWARRIAAHYTIGDHTCDHRDLTKMSRAQVVREIVTGARSIRRVTGRTPARLFRFPFGSGAPQPLTLANRLGYTAVGWTVDTQGWEGTSKGQTTRKVIQRAVGDLQPGEIILMHAGAEPNDRSTLDADALPTVIRMIQQRGYRFVSLDRYF